MIKRFTDSNVKYLLPIENNLMIEGVAVTLYVVFLLDYDSIKKILRIVGI
jgi:hypothetical protein